MSDEAKTTSDDSFGVCVKRAGRELRRSELRTVQVNVGKLCNQVCRHCHVDAGPNKKRENMDAKTADRILALIDKTPGVRELDLTGGAPELNPNFRRMVATVRAKGITVIDRCNLTVLFEPGQEDLASFLAEQGVQVVASMPCYSSANVDKQRGDGVFEKSIRGLQLLNELGYGREGSPLTLSLVYNPLGPSLPPPQSTLEQDYKSRLREDFGIEFSTLFTITNMPIKRFKFELKQQGALDSYMRLLADNFNPAAIDGVMCFSTVSISWDGRLFDCDFNQMLEMPLGFRARNIWDIESFADLEGTPIATDAHCFGCTAGAGSSCKGALA